MFWRADRNMVEMMEKEVVKTWQKSWKHAEEVFPTKWTDRPQLSCTKIYKFISMYIGMLTHMHNILLIFPIYYIFINCLIIISCQHTSKSYCNRETTKLHTNQQCMLRSHVCEETWIQCMCISSDEVTPYILDVLGLMNKHILDVLVLMN